MCVSGRRGTDRCDDGAEGGVEILPTTKKMAAAEVEESVDSTVETVLNEGECICFTR